MRSVGSSAARRMGLRPRPRLLRISHHSPALLFIAFIDLFGPARSPYDPIDLETAEGRRFANCAASVQRVLEDTLVQIARALRQETGLPDLCMGGGVALNGVANARILAESGFEQLFVPSAPVMPAVRWAQLSMPTGFTSANPDRELPDHPFWGPAVHGSELAQLAHEDGQPCDELDEPELIDRTADDLIAGRVVG